MMISDKRLKVATMLILAILLLSIPASVSFTEKKLDQIVENKSSYYEMESHGFQENKGNLSSVNPFQLYTKEPAPVGVTDFGIGPNDKPYEYSTNSFLGNVYVNYLSTYNSSINQSQTWVSFQLNVNLVFIDGNVPYVYWIQNVAEVNTSNNYVGFVDNIWNFSSASSSMNNSSVSGSGTVTSAGNTDYYYSIANQTLRGNEINLTAPYRISLNVTAGVGGNNKPYVSFLYNDGYGWVSYDNVSFIFATRLNSEPAFLVDGFNYEPTGYTYYDAELIAGGPGNGTSTFDEKSSVAMNLLYWNGHNYQDIPNAYNFGSNTAEAISNVLSGLYYDPGNGSIFSELRNGSGNLGILYYQNQLCSVNITLPVYSGILLVNGSRYSFVDYGINITLYPSIYNNRNGYYDFILESHRGIVEWEENISLRAGEHLSIELNLFKVEFEESGIPAGIQWYIHLSNGINYIANGSFISIVLPNGSYDYYVYIENDNSPISQGSFIVDGKNITIDITINIEKFKVNIVENGLPNGILWSIILNSIRFNSTNTSIELLLPNGTYNFTVYPIQGFRSDIENGILTVNNSYLTFTINWTVIDYNITFSIKGIPNGTGWYIMINGSLFYGKDFNQTFYSNSTAFVLSIPNGSYAYKIQIPNGFEVSPQSGVLNVNGSNYNIGIEVTKTTNIQSYSLNSISEGTILLIGLIIIISGTVLAYIFRKRE